MTAFRCFLGSKLGLTAMLAIAALGAYSLWSHTGHALAAAPYLLLLACPLMHLFGHRHSHHRPSAADLKFLHHPRQTRSGTSNRKAALES
jgi:hypothetical protein